MRPIVSTLPLLLSVFVFNLSAVCNAQEPTIDRVNETEHSKLVNLETEKDVNDVSEEVEFIWQITLGLSAGVHKSILAGDTEGDRLSNTLDIPLLIDVYYKGFFIQSSQRRIEGIFGNAEFGYQVSATENWSLDILSKTYIGDINSAEVIEDNELENSILEGLPTRRLGQGLGLRYSRFFDDDILYFDVASLVTIDGGNDYVVDIYYSHFIPYYNWNIYIGGGLTYFSEDATNYYVGIDHDEVTEQRQYYQVNSGGYSAQAEVLVLYPLSENWTFNAGINHAYYSSEVADSPIIERPDSTIASFGVLYAF